MHKLWTSFSVKPSGNHWKEHRVTRTCFITTGEENQRGWETWRWHFSALETADRAAGICQHEQRGSPEYPYVFWLWLYLNTFHKTHKIWMINTKQLDSHQLISNCSSGNIPNVKLKLCLYLGCILMNHSRGLKKSQHKLDAVLLHLKLTS